VTFGRFMDSLFKGPSAPVAGSTAEAPPQSAAQQPAESEDAAVLRALDELRAAVRSGGSEIPTLLISRFAHIDDLLRTVIETVAAQGASTEQRVLLEAMIRDYLPTPLRAFLALPHDQRSTTSRATLQLSTQLGILEETINDLLNQIRIGAIAELSTHGRFLQDKFAAPTLTLDGPS
jgi:hypothetical protein